MRAEARPLYLQVREALVQRIADGHWRAGDALPSELALAAELGVSQGTVRKALDTLAADHLVDRRQGRGTFVPDQTAERALFHFFRFEGPDGATLIPEPLDQTLARVAPPPAAAAALEDPGPDLWLITRRRSIAGAPALVEKIYLSPAHVPDPGSAETLPNALYSHYQALTGLSVVRAEDHLSACAAPAEIAAALGQPQPPPVLHVERRAFDLTGRVLEYRLSWCLTAHCRYRVTLG